MASAKSKEPALRYTVFIRVPLPRGDFEDPPAPNWNAAKDRELWKSLSSTSKGVEIDWNGLAVNFDVTLSFLLQQAAWLYERQLSQVREQLRRVGKPSSGSTPAPGSIQGSTTVGGQSMRRGPSGGSRVPSSLSVRPRGSLELRNDGSNPSTPVQQRVPYSRTTSANTITQLHRPSSSSHNVVGASPRLQRRSMESELKETRVLIQDNTPLKPSPSTASSPSSSSSSEGPVARSRTFSRRPRFSSAKSKGKATLHMLSSADEEEGEDDDSPAFLPFSPTRQNTATTPSKAATKELPVHAKGKQKAQQPTRTNTAKTSSPSSSASLSSAPNPSSSIPSLPSPAANATRSPPPTTRGLAALSPRQRRATRDGSEGTPSMGSSFSDLDDASITQSALEEALAREIKAGKGSLGVVGRMGGLWRGQGQGQGSRGTS